MTLIKWEGAKCGVAVGFFNGREFNIFRENGCNFIKIFDMEGNTSVGGWREDMKAAKERCEEIARDIQVKHGSKK